MIDLFKLNYFTADCAEACEKQLSKKNHDKLKVARLDFFRGIPLKFEP